MFYAYMIRSKKDAKWYEVFLISNGVKVYLANDN